MKELIVSMLLITFMIFTGVMIYMACESETPVQEVLTESFETPEMPETSEVVTTVLETTVETFAAVEIVDAPMTIEDEIWEYLHDFGFSDAVSAGIMGNMQVESSFRPQIRGYYYGNVYFGLCQWNLEYTPEAENLSVREQCWLIRETLAQSFKSWHTGSVKGYEYYLEAFENETDPGQAALIFAEKYERCGRGSYDARKLAAERIFEERTNVRSDKRK